MKKCGKRGAALLVVLALMAVLPLGMIVNTFAENEEIKLRDEVEDVPEKLALVAEDIRDKATTNEAKELILCKDGTEIIENVDASLKEKDSRIEALEVSDDEKDVMLEELYSEAVLEMAKKYKASYDSDEVRAVSEKAEEKESVRREAEVKEVLGVSDSKCEYAIVRVKNDEPVIYRAMSGSGGEEGAEASPSTLDDTQKHIIIVAISAVSLLALGAWAIKRQKSQSRF